MPIISSTVESKQLQADGTYLVVEQHVDEEGRKYAQVYNAPADIDTDAVCIQRGILLGAALDKALAQEALAANYEIPLTTIKILKRFTATEWDAFQLSTVKKIKYLSSYLHFSTTIYRTDNIIVNGFAELVTAGILTQARSDEILR